MRGLHKRTGKKNSLLLCGSMEEGGNSLCHVSSDEIVNRIQNFDYYSDKHRSRKQIVNQIQHFDYRSRRSSMEKTSPITTVTVMNF